MAEKKRRRGRRSVALWDIAQDYAIFNIRNGPEESSQEQQLLNYYKTRDSVSVERGE